MDPFLIALGSACWLGILTSISPCPLATNIAAVSYIGRRVDRPLLVLASGIIYTIGRTLTYVGLGMLIVTSILAIPEVAMFLQQYMGKALGPVLIVVGLFLLGLFQFRLPDVNISQGLQRRVEERGLWGAGVLGLLFALSFCPVSAALFFGSLIPLAVEHESGVLMPTVYGIGTALPVVVFAALIASGARFVGTVFNCLTQFEKWARRITGGRIDSQL
ncbi:MAG: sulfite exporter TauE/SafE family protein, partial [candidate division Zixibacteria bacterium]|nr:sulfite exporter TauE/SafE family protein [candidate division Zixibacteria bacterium]